MSRIYRICVPSAAQAGLFSPIAEDPLSAPFYTLVDIDSQENKSVHVLANPHPEDRGGLLTAWLMSQGVSIFIIPGEGGGTDIDGWLPHARQALIRVYTGAAGTVADAVEAYLANRLAEI